MPKTPLYLWNFGCACCEEGGCVEQLYVGHAGETPATPVTNYTLTESNRMDGTTVGQTVTPPDAGNNATPRVIRLDPVDAGNVYIGKNSGFIMRIRCDTFEQIWSTSGLGFAVNTLEVDNATGHMYVGGDGALKKFNMSDGTEITNPSPPWPVDFGTAVGGGNVDVRSVAIAPDTGNIWVGHQTVNDGSLYPSLSELDTDGAVLNQYQPFEPDTATANKFQVPYDIVFDSSGDMYVALTPVQLSGGSLLHPHIMKLNNAGTELWRATPDSISQHGNAITLYDGGNKVAVGTVQVGGSSNDTVYAYDASSGSLQWSDFADVTVIRSMSTDSDGAIYAGGAGTTFGEVYKYDSAGVQPGQSPFLYTKDVWAVWVG